MAVLTAVLAGAGAWMVRGHGQTTEATPNSPHPSAIPQPRTESDPSAGSPHLNPPRTASKPTDIHLLADEDYAPAIERLLSEAKTSIDVTMFSCVLPDQASAKHPVRRLLDCLVAQHRAGVTVRVVFDQGAPVSRTGDDREPPSRNAGRYLKSAGVDIRWDEDRRTTHTKSLTVDGRWCVVGSTNWSASALGHNREQSLLVDSPALAG